MGCSADYWQKGYAVICPHANSANMSGVCDENIFLMGYKIMISFCDVGIVLPGWEDSEGAKDEVALFKAFGKKLIYYKGE